MAGEKILIVDDEREISDLLTLYLAQNGFQVFSANDGLMALSLNQAVKPDLIILDVLLPDLDGLEVCQELRKTSNVPILFLSCKSEETDQIVALTVGGDDYISKPFRPGELVARVKAHLRRTRLSQKDHAGSPDKTLTYPGLVIDPLGHMVFLNNVPISLSVKEFEILALLARNPNKVFSSENLLQSVWDYTSTGDIRTVMVHMSKLRKKLEQDPDDPKYIQTIRGIGYKFVAGGSPGPGKE